MTDPRAGGIAILDFGSQYTQLIARRIREQGVYAAVYPWDAAEAGFMRHQPRGVILSGGPASVNEPDAPRLPRYLLTSGLPLLGICYGLQALAQELGGEVVAAGNHEYGSASIHHNSCDPLLNGLPSPQQVWMSHGDRVTALPPGFTALAKSDNSPYAIIGHAERQRYGVQFHPEVAHTPQGNTLLRNFLFAVCACQPGWSPQTFIESASAHVRDRVGEERVLLGLSGGVDSAVTAMLLHRAIGAQLTAIFIDNGLLRKDEAREVIEIFRDRLGLQLLAVDAGDKFLRALRGISQPERKRKIIGALFIECFAEQARALQGAKFLAQGTIYPDVIESAASSVSARNIKSHHNVGGLPQELQFELVEPLRDLFKDEVREVGTALGLPEELVWRQPFPGPGLAVRCIGRITRKRLATLREADAIFRDELHAAGLLLRNTSQSFAVLLPVKNVGVQGDQRTWEEVIALRSVTTDDFMTADWSRLEHELLAQVSRRIVNEVRGVNRVVYDITSKPPGTIEWE